MAAEFDGWAIARQRIAKEARERTGKLNLAGLGLEKTPPEVAGLTHLRELVLGSRDGEEVTNDAGQSFESRDNRIADLAPLVRLTALQSLNCGFTQVADLAPLAQLTALQLLHCNSTQVADLAPLARLTALQSLNCGLTEADRSVALRQILACRVHGVRGGNGRRRRRSARRRGLQESPPHA
jgi:Leucine-rich repeat (LRR) protein